MVSVRMLSDRVRGWWCKVWHDKHHHVVMDGGEVFLRCKRCLFRSPGLSVGAPRVKAALPGVPDRHVLRPTAARVVNIEEGRHGRRA